VPGLRVVVASGDAPVLAACRSAGVDALQTPTELPSGTHRVGRAAAQLGADDVPVINVQGDEPFVEPADVGAVLEALESGAEIATLAAPLLGDPDAPDRVKVRMSPEGLAQAFSRADLGLPRWQHLGLYGFAPGVLPRLLALPETAGERRERLEQLRWLEHGHPIHVRRVRRAALSVDTPDDLRAARAAVARSQ
jgi:3-deoxy-manno-octulosonate cytidylyltransferase (CMP-KDO synthetase)